MLREQLNAKNPELINAAIEHIAKIREDQTTKHFYAHDVFYRKVSKIQEIFNALYLIENEVIKVNSNEQALNYMLDTTLFLSVCKTFAKFENNEYEHVLHWFFFCFIIYF